MEQKNALFEFNKIIDSIYGVYLDSSTGFVHNKAFMERTQRDAIKKNNLTQEYLDNCAWIYGVGDPNKQTSYPLNKCTQKEFKERNSVGGINSKTLGNLCIVQLYQYWEDYYRSKISKLLFCEKNDLKSDLFNDLKLFRRSIIHHRAIALNEVSKCKKFKWFKEGDEIKFNDKQIEEIIRRIKMELDAYNNLISLIENRLNKNEA